MEELLGGLCGRESEFFFTILFESSNRLCCTGYRDLKRWFRGLEVFSKIATTLITGIISQVIIHVDP